MPCIVSTVLYNVDCLQPQPIAAGVTCVHSVKLNAYTQHGIKQQRPAAHADVSMQTNVNKASTSSSDIAAVCT
jgi:hypothetical protein